MAKFTISRIKEEMTKAGISFTGIYENLPQMVLDALDTVETFGFDHWAHNSTAGPKIKALVKQLNTLRLMYLFNDQIESIAVYAKAINFDIEHDDFSALLRGWLEQGRKFAIACETNEMEVLTLIKKINQMTYLNTLPGFQTLQRIFSNAGFDFDIDLSNSPLIMKNGKYYEYNELPIDLQTALDAFAELNNFE